MRFKIETLNRFLTKPLALLIALAVAPFAFAQTAPPQSAAGDSDGKTSKGAVMKGKAPINRETLRIKLPKPQEATLPNGLQIVLLENRKTPTFLMAMTLRTAGGTSDPADKRGVGLLTGLMLREGTSKRTSLQISEQLESVGATLTTQAQMASFISNVGTGGLLENFDQTLDVFADIIRNPQFLPAEVEKLKARQQSQYQLQRSAPQALLGERFFKVIYGTHPAGTFYGTPEMLSRITSDDLKRFHRTYYRPNDAHLVVVGSISMKELLPKLEKAFGDWQKGDVPPLNFPAINAPEKTGVFLINRPDSVQTNLRVGSLSIVYTDPDYYALEVMNRILGGGASGRLFMNLREAKGYAYGAYSIASAAKYPGMVFSEAAVRTEVTAEALRELMYELGRIRDEKVPPAELENAKRALTGNFAISLEQPQALAYNFGTLKLFDLTPEYLEKYPQRIGAVTAEDVQRVARKYYDPARLQIVAVGDAAKIRDALSKYGAVEAFDADGKPATR